MRRAPLYALFVADVISLSGNAVAQVAIPWYVLTTTGSPGLTGLVVFFNFLPIVIAAFFGGVIVDRLGFRTSSVVADLASSAAVAAIPVLHSTVGIEIWQLMVLVFVGALLDAPGATARTALFPDAVELAGVRMERASGIRSGIQSGAFLVGGPIGGVLVAAFGATAALWLDAASFLVSAGLIVLFIPRPAVVERPQPRERYLTELAEGMRFIWDRRLVRAMVLTVLVANFLDAPFPVAVTVLAEEAYGSATDLGLIYGVFGGSALAGALVYSAIGHRLPRRWTFVVGFSIVPIAYLALAALPPLEVTLVALAVSGFAAGPINPLIFTVLTEIVPSHLRGRVFGAVRAGAWASIPAGILVGSAVVGAAGVAATFLAIGLGYAALVAYGFFNPAFRELDSGGGGVERAEEAASA